MQERPTSLPAPRGVMVISSVSPNDSAARFAGRVAAAMAPLGLAQAKLPEDTPGWSIRQRKEPAHSELRECELKDFAEQIAGLAFFFFFLCLCAGVYK